VYRRHSWPSKQNPACPPAWPAWPAWPLFDFTRTAAAAQVGPADKRAQNFGRKTCLETKTMLRILVFTAVTMKSVVFWDVTPCGSYKNQRFGWTYASIIRVTSHNPMALQGLLRGWLYIIYVDDVRFEVFTAVTMKNCVFWDVTLCCSCKNQRFGGTWRLLHQGDKNR
jgi:hypothetical protein